MPTDHQSSDAHPALDPEFARVLRMGDPGMALDGPLTFLPPLAATHDGWRQAWRAWRDGTLSLTLAPCLATAAVHAEQGLARELQMLDRELDAGLDEATRIRSVAAGRRLLRRLANARGERWLDKFQAAVAADGTPGHFAVVFAGQSALFHFSRLLLLPSYAYWEWCAAMSALPPAGRPLPVFAAELDGINPHPAAVQPPRSPSIACNAAENSPFAHGAS